VGVEDAADIQPKKFSRGMLQRIGIAQALINDPKLVILDEPMASLDPVGRKHVRDLILSLKLQGKTIIFSSHILSDIEMVCDRVAIINKGRLQKVCTIDEMLDSVSGKIELVVKGLQPDAIARLQSFLHRVWKAASFGKPDLSRASSRASASGEKGSQTSQDTSPDEKGTENIIQKNGRTTLILPDQKASDEALSLIGEYNAKLVSLVPQASLEDLFMRELTRV